MPKEAYGIGALVATLIAFIFLITYSGPYRIIADVQVGWFQTNVVNISFLVTVAVVAAPILVTLRLFERRLGTRETWFTPVWGGLDRMLDVFPGKLLMIGAVLLIMGGYFAVKEFGRGQLTELSVADLEKGQPPRSHYVQLIDGDILEQTNLRFESKGTVHRYVPVINAADRPVLFLRIGQTDDIPESGKISGLLDLNGMEGELRSQLEAVHAIGDTHYVLGVGGKPAPAFGCGMAAIGFGLCAIGVLWWRLGYTGAA